MTRAVRTAMWGALVAAVTLAVTYGSRGWAP